MNNTIYVEKIGIADMNVVKAPAHIRTSGLGSCIGIILYDLPGKVAGLAHIMLPESSLARSGEINKAKYADTAILELQRLCVLAGAKQINIKAKIAGGAQMFQFASGSDLMRIGPRNAEAVKQELGRLKIPLIAEDIGGNSGRTIQFNPQNGELTVKTVNGGTLIL